MSGLMRGGMADFFQAQLALDHETTVHTLELVRNQNWQILALGAGCTSGCGRDERS